MRHNPEHHWDHWENRKRKKTLEETSVNEKYPRSSFFAFHACNGQCEWLIIPFEIKSNLFKILCI